MTKPSTPTQGDELFALVGSGSVMDIRSRNAATAEAVWPDLTFHPHAAQSGNLMEPDQWRNTVNPIDGASQA